MYLKIILLVLLILPELLYSQDSKAFKNDFLEAEYFFLSEHYEEAAFLYQQLLKTDTSNYNLHFLLGASYLSSHTKKIRAIPHLEMAVANMSPGYREGNWKERNAPREALFALAKAYHIANRFDEAIDLYKKYNNVMGIADGAESGYVQQQIKSAELARQIVRDTTSIKYGILGDSFFQNCYRAVLAERDSIMVFMTDRPFYSPIMMSKMENGRWTEPEILNDKLKIDGNYNLCSISYDGAELYIAMEKDFIWDIYISYFENGRWTPVQPLNPNINSEFNETHASITPDKRRIFFTSDRPGGMGAMDIYFSDRNANADWKEPVNIGPPVNSVFSEETPFPSADGNMLYFSSKGHETMGGFDIYFSKLLKGNQWSPPVNAGFPLNTADDDLFLVPLQDFKYALYTPSSGLLPQNTILAINIFPEISDPGNTIMDQFDTYEVNGNELAENNIKDTEIAKNVLPGKQNSVQSSEIETSQNKISESIASTKEAEKVETVFQAPLPETAQSEIVESKTLIPTAEKEDSDIASKKDQKSQYATSEAETISTEVSRPTENFQLILAGESQDIVSMEPQFSPGDTAANIENLILQSASGTRRFILSNTILFGFESFQLSLSAMNKLDTLYTLLKEKPDLRVEITGYSDSKGPAEYNLRLSRKRSDAVINYLVKRGIERSNLNSKGAGETHFVAINTNPDGSDNPEGRKYNRRAEISLLNSLDESIILEALYVPEHLRFIYPGEISPAPVEFNSLAEMKPSSSSPSLGNKKVYTIQLLAMRTPVREDFFEASEGVTRVQREDGLYRYIAGSYESIQDAKAFLSHYTELGFTDAFVRVIP